MCFEWVLTGDGAEPCSTGCGFRALGAALRSSRIADVMPSSATSGSIPAAGTDGEHCPNSRRSPAMRGNPMCLEYYPRIHACPLEFVDNTMNAHGLRLRCGCARGVARRRPAAPRASVSRRSRRNRLRGRMPARGDRRRARNASCAGFQDHMGAGGGATSRRRRCGAARRRRALPKFLPDPR